MREAIKSKLGGYAEDLAAVLSEINSLTSGSVAAGVAATVTAEEAGTGPFHQTTLTLTDVPQAVVNGTEYQATELYDFPEGRILVLGAAATLQQKTTSDPATTINASADGAIAIGTAAATNVSLTGSMVDLIPSTAFVASATQNVAGTAVSAALAASAQFDGTGGAKKVYLNTAYATTLQVDGNGTQTISGTVKITWVFLGDY